MRILIVGFGDVASRLAPLLTPRFKVYGLIRDPKKSAALRLLGVRPIVGDLDDRKSLSRMAGLADFVIHLAPPAPHGTRDLRTRRLLAALSHRAAVRSMGEYSPGPNSSRCGIVYVSTTGVYGDCAGAWVSESRPPRPESPRARRRLDAEQALRGWMRSLPARRFVCMLRAPGIYAADRLPLERLNAGTPALHPEEDSYSNHIHADDLARAAVSALFRGANGRTYNCCDDAPLQMGDYFDAVADRFGLPRPPRISRAEAERTLSDALLSFLRESRRLDNARLRHELGLELAYPTVTGMLDNLTDGVVDAVLSARGGTRPR